MVVAARCTSCKPPLHCCLAQTTHPVLPRHSPYGELRCVLAVIRHGDRTPKQKMKMKVTQEPLLALLHKHLDSKGKQAKLKVGAECRGLEAVEAVEGGLGWMFRLPNRIKGRVAVVVLMNPWHNGRWVTVCWGYLTCAHCSPSPAPQSPNELQDLLDATRLLLDELEAKQRAAADAAAAGGQAPAPDPDTDELREKFRIMKARGTRALGGLCGGGGQYREKGINHAAAAMAQ